MRWRKVSLIGVGLLGGSLGLALRERKLSDLVAGYVRRQESIEECLRHGAVDFATLDLLEAVKGADLVVFCTPLAQMPQLAKTIAPNLEKETIVTDVGSVKGMLVAELAPVFQEHSVTFIGSHPMAGSEKTGVAFARADLFQNASCAVTPGKEAPRAATEKIEELWRKVGSKVIRLTPELHDELVSRSSHLPHVLAALLAGYVLDPKHPTEQTQLCANGFKDCTRIASSSPEMWRDIVMMNREYISNAMGQYVAEMREFAGIMERNDPTEIEQFFRTAKSLRDSWGSQAPSPSPE